MQESKEIKHSEFLFKILILSPNHWQIWVDLLSQGFPRMSALLPFMLSGVYLDTSGTSRKRRSDKFFTHIVSSAHTIIGKRALINLIVWMREWGLGAS